MQVHPWVEQLRKRLSLAVACPEPQTEAIHSEIPVEKLKEAQEVLDALEVFGIYGAELCFDENGRIIVRCMSQM